MLIMIWLVFSFYHQLIFYLKSIFNFSYIFFFFFNDNNNFKRKDFYLFLLLYGLFFYFITSLFFISKASLISRIFFLFASKKIILSCISLGIGRDSISRLKSTESLCGYFSKIFLIISTFLLDIFNLFDNNFSVRSLL